MTNADRGQTGLDYLNDDTEIAWTHLNAATGTTMRPASHSKVRMASYFMFPA